LESIFRSKWVICIRKSYWRFSSQSILGYDIII
jgi:hypothetical protein